MTEGDRHGQNHERLKADPPCTPRTPKEETSPEQLPKARLSIARLPRAHPTMARFVISARPR